MNRRAHEPERRDWHLLLHAQTFAPRAGLYTTPSNETLTMLRITVHDDFKHVTLQVEGRLAEPSLDVLEDCWRSAVAERRAVRIDLRAVTFVDAAGKECLARMHRQGAELIAADCAMTHIVAEIMRSSPRDWGNP